MNDTHKRLLEEIFATREDEIQCDEAAIQMARSAEDGLTEAESRRQYPALWHHFRYCTDCAEEYRMLMELARAEAAGDLPPLRSVPPRPTEKKAGIWELLATAIKASFSGFGAAPALAGLRAPEPALEPVDVALADGALTVTLDLAPDEAVPGAWELFCTLEAEAPELRAAFEGSSAWLQIAPEGPVMREASIDEAGMMSFPHVLPGTYTLRFRLGQQEYAVQDIAMPSR